MFSWLKSKKETGSKEVKEEPDLPHLLILYGSQTGIAEGFAKQLSREVMRCRFIPEVLSASDYDFRGNMADEKLIACLFSTQGDGEPTDDALEFHTWLNETQDSVLSSTKYAVFALGSTAYEKFCVVGKNIDERLGVLGGKRICPLGLGDDDKSIEDDFNSWSSLFLEALAEYGGAPADVLTISTYKIAQTDKPATPPYTQPTGRQMPSSSRPFYAKVIENVEMCRNVDDTPESKSVHKIELSLEGCTARYAAGDHIGVYASNSDEQVNRLARLLGIGDLDQVFTLEPQSVCGLSFDTLPPLFPLPTTYRTVFTQLLDITAPVGIYGIKILTEFAGESAESLKALASDYSQKVKSERMCLADLLETCTSISLPLEFAFEIIPKMSPRFYSIASSQKLAKDSVRLVVTLLRYKTPNGKIAIGTCSSHLCSSSADTLIPIFFRRSSFHLPRNTRQPIVLIGPGCGVAPFIGFMEELECVEKDKIGENMMLFGCRSKNDDYLFGDELAKWKEDGVLTNLHVAFSRESDKKFYVQNLIRQDDIGTMIAELLSKKRRGILYVCGDAGRMASDVHEAVIDVVSKHMSLSHEEAVKYVHELELNGRYLKDTW